MTELFTTLNKLFDQQFSIFCKTNVAFAHFPEIDVAVGKVLTFSYFIFNIIVV